MQFLLDTNVVSDFFCGHPEVTRQLTAHSPQELALSTITVHEIEFGMQRQPLARRKFGILWSALQRDMTVLDLDKRSAEHAATIRAELASIGKPIGPYNLLIAGTALAYGLTLVAHNTRESERVEELRLVDWWQAD